MGTEEPHWAKNLRGTALFLALVCVYIMVSSSMIVTNKYVVHKDRFPFPVVLVLIHVVFCWFVTLVLYKLAPSLFPALTGPEAMTLCNVEVVKRIIPIAFLFAGTLVMNNSALLYSDVASLQMIKESIVVMVYFWSVVSSVERFGFGQLMILLGILVATAMATEGQVQFSAVGFSLQFAAMFSESIRAVLQSTLMSGNGTLKFDPLSYLLVVSPVCIVYLVITLLIGHQAMHLGAFAIPSVAQVLMHWPMLLGSAFLAFLLSFLLACMFTLASPVSVVLSGIARDIIIVGGGALIFREMITLQQAVAFSIQIVLIGFWSSTKLYPGKFSNGPPSMQKGEAKTMASFEDAGKAV